MIGAISLFVTVKYPTIAPTAMVATFVTAAVMLALYQSRVIRVTEKFRSVLISAVIAITLVYLVQIGLSLFSSSIPYLFSGGVVAIGFSLFVVIIASLGLLLDFDNVERAKAAGVDESYEQVLVSVFCRPWYGCILSLCVYYVICELIYRTHKKHGYLISDRVFLCRLTNF